MKKVAMMGWSQGPSSFGVGKAYLGLMNEVNASVVIMTPQMFLKDGRVDEDVVLEFFDGIDMLLMSGGLDVNPLRYGDVPGYNTQNPNIILEWFDEKILPIIVEKTDVPIFGICRGMQSLCVYFGAKMNQDWSHPVSDKHRGELVEKLALPLGLRLEDIPYVLKLENNKNAVRQEINSLHHQHVNLASLNETQMNCIFVSDKTRTPEVVVSDDDRFVGMQYHPEEIYDELSLTVLNKLLNR